ncbi:evbL [Actinomadura sp. NAK00032]|uniref:SCO6745 family protein n=1 Tax=Actinomadura sp. NAK00032 TaxID=2742128 RepID=UPI00158FAE96|nr:evbL [Actinomadura sp. NAK00032]QKW38082.1 evbL [Actinomadura sp. NAK00032]
MTDLTELPELSAAETARAADKTIHDIGSTWMLDPSVSERGKELGYANPFAFYFAGRGGVLGDADGGVVWSALGFFEPGVVRAMWDEGVAVAGAREAARRYTRAFTAWAEERVPADPRLCELAERVANAADGAGLPLFCGWRAEPLPEPGPGRLVQVFQVLRELRGGMHLVATTAVGLTPLEAVLTNEGEGKAKFCGWRGEFPDCTALKPRLAEAEEITDRLSAAVYERALSPAERAEFAGLVAKAGAAVLP